MGFVFLRKLQFSHCIVEQGLITALHMFSSACKILNAFSVSFDLQFAVGLSLNLLSAE